MTDQPTPRHARKEAPATSEGPVVAFLRKQAAPYFAKAVVLVATLTLLGHAAPQMPTAAIALAVGAYAVVSLVGTLYFVVTRRIHKQFKLAEGGSLSRINRKWRISTGILFAMALASGFLFVLSAPKWDFAEWLLVWLAIPLYLAVFAVVRLRLAREFAPRFDKANAMRLSFALVGVVLCLVYAALSLQSPPVEYAGLEAAYESTFKPFAASPSALMNDVDKLTSLTDGLSAYGLSQASGVSVAVAFAVRFAVYASVFFGLMSQFGACLLDASEVKGEFQLLPADAGASPEGPVLKSYFAVLAGVFAVFLALLLVADAKVAEAQATEEHTAIEAFVDEQIRFTTHMVDGEYEAYVERKDVLEEYGQAKERLLQERNDALRPLVEGYYDACRGNVDAYVDWAEGPDGGLRRLFAFLGTGQVRGKFMEIVTRGTDGAEIERRFEEYQQRLADLEEQVDAELQGSGMDGLPAGAEFPADARLALWQPFDAEDGKAVDAALLNSDDPKSREDYRAKVAALVDEAQADTLRSLGM